MDCTRRVMMNDNDLRVVAERFIYVGADVIDPDALVEAQRQIARKFARAAASGLTQRHVVVGLLAPILSGTTHCRCSSCQEKCIVCRNENA